jgi:hypothetical protein
MERFKVTLDMQIDDISQAGGNPFSTFSAVYYDCSREVMHSIESAIAKALIELGDAGLAKKTGKA